MAKLTTIIITIMTVAILGFSIMSSGAKAITNHKANTAAQIESLFVK